MKKRIVAILLVLCLLPACGFAEINSEYLAELQLLNEYLRTAGENAPVGIEKICDQIEGNGRIGEYTVEFGIYANVLRLLEAEDYSAALSEASDLLNGSSFEKFRAYLADGAELRSWGLYALDSVERLYSYVQGRASEANDDWKKATQYYSTCEQFMDARERKQIANQFAPSPDPALTSTPTPSPTLTSSPTISSTPESPLTYTAYADHVEITGYGLSIGLPENLTIPAQLEGKPVTVIGENAFEGCKGLQNVSLPDSITSIEAYAFFNCENLTGINIPNGVTRIGEYVFGNCISLTDVRIPSGVEFIGNGAFGACFSITSITIPYGITSIGDNTFAGCSFTDIIIPDSVESIGYDAFISCTSLTNVVIPGSVKIIGLGAFAECTSLTNVVISDGVTTIADNAFDGCTNLDGITIPNSVTSIGEHAFHGCDRLVVNCPADSFAYDYCMQNGIASASTSSPGSLREIYISNIPDFATNIYVIWDEPNLTDVFLELLDPGNDEWIGQGVYLGWARHDYTNWNECNSNLDEEVAYSVANEMNIPTSDLEILFVFGENPNNMPQTIRLCEQLGIGLYISTQTDGYAAYEAIRNIIGRV